MSLSQITGLSMAFHEFLTYIVSEKIYIHFKYKNSVYDLVIGHVPFHAIKFLRGSCKIIFETLCNRSVEKRHTKIIYNGMETVMGRLLIFTQPN